MKYQKILLLILFISGFFNAGAQMQEQKIVVDSVFAFRFDPGNPDDLNSFFVKELARYNYLNLYKTEYLLSYVLEISISKTANGNYNIIPDIKGIEISGDIYYEKFDLGDVLMPSRFNVELMIKEDSSVRSFSFNSLNPVKDIPLLISEIKSDLFTYPGFEISNVSFHYDEADKQVFFDRIKSIHQFLGFYELLAFNLQKSYDINPATQDGLLSVFFEISDLRRFIDMLEKNEPPVALPDFYKISFHENHRQIKANLRRLETLYGQNVDTLSLTMSSMEMEEAASTIVDLQQNYMTLMKSSNHLFEPVYLSVVNFFPSINNWTPYEESLRKLIQKETTTEFADQAIKSFCKTLYINYINEADSLISDEKYSEADLMIKNASTFCNLNPDKQCEILTFNKLAQAKYGIFDAYLQVALSAMEMGKLEFAQNYLRLAMEFQIANSNIIISSTTVEQYYEELAWAYFEAAKDFYNLENFREAFDAYVNARQIYDLIEIDTYDELIDKQIKRCFINN